MSDPEVAYTGIKLKTSLFLKFPDVPTPLFGPVKLIVANWSLYFLRCPDIPAKYQVS